MRILLLNFEFPPIGGGGSYACRNIVKELSEKGIMVDIVTSSPDNKFRTEKIGRNATVYRLNVRKKDIHYWKLLEIIRFSFKHWLFAGKLLRKNKYNLCHVFFTVPCGGIALWYKLWNRLPYIVSIRGSDVPGFDKKRWNWFYPILKPVIRMIWSNANAVISNSDGLRKLAYETAPRQKISVIYNGINARDFKPGRKSPKYITVLSTSRLIKRKGINYLIQAVSDASEVCKNIRLVLVGEGNREEEYRALVKKLNLQHKVKFEGYVSHDNIRKFYSEADMFVIASTNEGMSNSLLEAMASGLPIIATDTGGTKELIKGNGIIIPMEDSDAIAKAIIKLSSKKLREEMGKRSIEIAKGLDWSRIAEQYMNVYEKVRE